MALTRLLLSLLLLSSLLVISSANYNYQYSTQHANVDNDKQTLLDHDQLLYDNNLIPTDHIFDLGSTYNGHNYQQYYDHHDDQQKLLPDQLHDNVLTPTKQDHYGQYYYYQKSGEENYFVPSEPAKYYEKSNLEGKGNIVPTKLSYVGEPKNYDQVHQRRVPNIKYIAIRGLVLCNSGESYAPLKGAKARITCETKEDKNGYGKTTPISIVTDVTDENGFFFKALPLSYVHQVKLNLHECKVFLEAPSSECNCKVPTDVNYGKSGARLSSVRILNDKFLFTVGPFIYSSYSSPYKQTIPNDHSVDPGGY